jgi:hypothetical protein
LPRVVTAALSARLLPLWPTIAAFRTLPLLLTTIAFLHALPRLTATFGAWTLLGLTAVIGLIAVSILGTLLPLLATVLTGSPLALIGVPIPIFGTSPIIGVAITVLSALPVIGVAITVLSALPVIGIAITILGASPVIGIAVAILGTSPIVGVAISIVRALPIVGVAALVRTLLSSCGARRIITQAALLARTERTRRGHVPLRPDLGARLPNRHLRTEALTTAQVLLTHHDRTPNPRGADQHPRLNLVGPQRAADRSRNEGCWDAGVDGKARPAIADDDGAIDHHGLAEEDRILTFRHHH